MPMSAPETRSPRLLIVDDEEPILFALETYFLGGGFDVRCARGLPDALALAEAETFDLVIADLRLSASDEPEGMELLMRLRDGGPHPRVIILTAVTSDETERSARENGADAYLHKPQPLDGLEALVRDLLALPPAPANRDPDSPRRCP